jgi:hypothetical protein
MLASGAPSSSSNESPAKIAAVVGLLANHPKAPRVLL